MLALPQASELSRAGEQPDLSLPHAELCTQEKSGHSPVSCQHVDGVFSLYKALSLAILRFQRKRNALPTQELKFWVERQNA